MINLDTIIKFVRARSRDNNWPDYSYNLLAKIKECLLGFPGISLNDVSLMTYEDININRDIWILDEDLSYWMSEERTGDSSPLMLSPDPQIPGSLIVEGIGCLLDSRDLDRKNIRWKDHYPDNYPMPFSQDVVLRVDCRPTDNGGPGYYYFFKAYRDQRP